MPIHLCIARSELNLLRESELRSLIKVSHSTIHALIKQEVFPPPVRIGLRAVAWRESDIREWVARPRPKGEGASWKEVGAMMLKPPIVEVIGQYMELGKVGRLWRGLCPFHPEKTPSFFINEEEGFFHCFGCREHGDVIAFIQKIEKISFPEALKRLGLKSEFAPKPTDERKQCAARVATNWLNDQHLKLGAMLREVSRQIVIAEAIGDSVLVERLTAEWETL
jgi:predicted DNA-binding transcriptional regulator AlpA